MPPFFVPASRQPASGGPAVGVDGGDRETRGRRNLASGEAGLVHASYLIKPRILHAPKGSLIEIKLPPRPQERKPGRRGKVTEFSRAARWRMRKFLASLERAALPCFLTLTYPGLFCVDPEGWKANLDRIGVAFGRRFPGLGFVWKLEIQERGAPHFHLLIYGLEGKKKGGVVGTGVVRQEACHTRKEVREWVGPAWASIVGYGGEIHAKVGTKLERIRKPNGVQSYVAGYASKEDQTLQNVEFGKWWGKFHVEHLPTCEVEEVELTHKGSWAVARFLRRYRLSKRKAGWRKQRERSGLAAKPKGDSAGSFTVIGDAGQLLGRVSDVVRGAEWYATQRRAEWMRHGWDPDAKRPSPPPGRGVETLGARWKRSAAGLPPTSNPLPSSRLRHSLPGREGEHLLAGCGGGALEPLPRYSLLGVAGPDRKRKGGASWARQQGWADWESLAEYTRKAVEAAGC